MAQRVKQIKQKTSNGFTDSIPIGSQGQYIDMFSDLDLEEQLKLGTKCETQISKSNNVTTINQYYPIKNSFSYKVTNTITSSNDGSTIQMYYYNSQNSLLHNKTVTIEKDQDNDIIKEVFSL